MNFADQLKAYPLKKIDAIVFDDSILSAFESIVKWECTKRTQRFEQRQLKGYFVYTNDGETENYSFVSTFPYKLTNANLNQDLYEHGCRYGTFRSKGSFVFYEGTESLYHRRHTNYQFVISEHMTSKINSLLRNKLGFNQYELKVLNIEETNEIFSKTLFSKNVHYEGTGNIYQVLYLDLKW